MVNSMPVALPVTMMPLPPPPPPPPPPPLNLVWGFPVPGPPKPPAPPVAADAMGAELRPAGLARGQQIGGVPPLAVRFAKRAVNGGMQTDLDSGLEYGRYAAAMLIDSDDRKEGMRAFVEKRKPVFQGR